MQISLTRLLNEIKVTDAKINSTVRGKSFIANGVGSKLPTGYSSKDELETQLKSNFQSVKDLLIHRSKLKSLLVNANATTTVVVAGETLTIAQAIERKRTIALEKEFLHALNQQFTSISNAVTNHNTKVDQQIDTQLQALFGKDRKVSTEEAEAVSVPYRKQNEAIVIDPLNLRVEIEKLQNFITQFESEVDFILSEANARTLVEV